MKTRALCGLCEGGLLYDETVDPPLVSKCPCRRTDITPEQAKREALNAVTYANPSAFADAYRIIEAEARVSMHLSANTTRAAMDTADIPGPVVGAAFRKAVDEGILEADGMVKSTQLATHAHKISSYRSRLFVQDRRAGVA